MTVSVIATVLESTALCLISFVAIIGNLSLLLVVHKNKSLRSITSMFIVNLAAADILVSVLGMPITVVTIIKESWVFGHTACVALGFSTMLSFIASVMSLGMIAINRYFCIVKWNTYTNTFSKRKALLYGAAVWVISISLASLPLFGWAEYRFIPEKSYCFVSWPSNVYFTYFMITVCFFGPLTAMTFSYHKILVFTRDAKRKVAASRNNFTSPPQRREPAKSDETQNNIPEIIELACNKDERPQLFLQKDTERPKTLGRMESKLNLRSKFRVTWEEARMTNTLILMVALFVICWAPFAVTILFYAHHPRPLPRTLYIVSLLLGYLNSACNPILYGVRNPAFKRELLNLYSRCIPERLKPLTITQLLNKNKLHSVANSRRGAN